MGRIKRETTVYECDRCGATLTSEDIAADELAVNGPSARAFRAVLGPVVDWKIQYRMGTWRWLCSVCCRKYEMFMHGAELAVAKGESGVGNDLGGNPVADRDRRVRGVGVDPEEGKV